MDTRIPRDRTTSLPTAGAGQQAGMPGPMAAAARWVRAPTRCRPADQAENRRRIAGAPVWRRRVRRRSRALRALPVGPGEV